MSEIPYLKPFWRYYGGKWRAAPHYPAPVHRTIVEPFAGAAGYSLRHYRHDVILVEKYAKVAEMWRYIIGVSAAEIRSIPFTEDVRDLPGWVPQGGRDLVGFAMNAATVAPSVTLSSGRKKMRAAGRNFEGWSDAMKERVASQVDKVRHWKVIEGDYTNAPDVTATWFIDPPYLNQAGSYYVENCHGIDYANLADYCQSRKGQVLVCENDGATWLPFQPFRRSRSSNMSKRGGISNEALWTNADKKETP